MPRRGEHCSESTKAKLRASVKARDIRGSRNPNWRGGRVQLSDGRTAVYAPGHPGAVLFGGTHILEYRLIAEALVGRPLKEDEVVHHRNGDPTDNRLENLEVMTFCEHARLHSSQRRDPVTGQFYSAPFEPAVTR